MDIVLAIVFGAVVGLAAHFALPGRPTRGAGIAPLVGAVVGAAVWTGMTWLGQTTSDPWIWLASIVAPAVVTFPAVAILTSVRRRHDEHARTRLGLS
jgi:uncharacterized membrane protein YeaQ/YmgE (transglycosylase-associated protein family)